MIRSVIRSVIQSGPIQILSTPAALRKHYIWITDWVWGQDGWILASFFFFACLCLNHHLQVDKSLKLITIFNNSLSFLILELYLSISCMNEVFHHNSCSVFIKNSSKITMKVSLKLSSLPYKEWENKYAMIWIAAYENDSRFYPICYCFNVLKMFM